MTILRTFLCAAALVAASAWSALAGDGAAAVRQVLMTTFDRPDAPLTVEPVTVVGGIAVAGWSQGEMGGRALLREKDGAWVLVLCSGDALKDPTALRHFGLAPADADALAAAVTAAESTVDPALVARFSTFDGVVMMDADGGHPPTDAHHGAHHGG